MLEPVVVRTFIRPSLSLVRVAAFLVGFTFGMAITMPSLHRFEAFKQATYSRKLGAKLIGLRTDPYLGPSVVLACLATGAFCYEEWVSYAAIDAVADPARLDPYGECVAGCLFVLRDGGDWTCERHAFYLPLTDPR